MVFSVQDLQIAMFWLPASLVLLVVAVCFVVRVFVKRRGVGWGPWLCYQVACLQSLLFTRWYARNECTYPEQGPAIIVSNHTSPVDPVMLWIRHHKRFRNGRMRIIRYMMAKEYYVQPGPVGWVCRTMQSIPVERAGQDMAPIRDALNCLENGDLLGLFPEGRINVRTPDETLLPGGTGVAWLAMKSGAPVLPVFIHDAPRGRSMVSSFFRRTRTSLTYGEPVDLTPWRGKKLTRAVLAEVTDHIMQSLADLGNVRFTPVSSCASKELEVAME